ncbi:MAG: xanthine dehydrogenase family protein subunit M [Melioribacteraceae bacterium]|nr:xanthine dehydrogenase family protein subunit M [Melioribacteraceae bacterium]
MNKFEYFQPKSVKSASKFIAKNKSSIAFAGGTDILGLMKDDIQNPEYIVNLKNIDNLSYIKFDENNALRIGALTKLNDIAENTIVQERYTALSEAISQLATPQLRNVGTLGGNICQRPRCFYFRGDYDCIRKGGDECYAFYGNNKYHCIIGGDPCYIVHPSDTAVVLIAMDAKFKIVNSKEERIVDGKDFFLLLEIDETKENILEHGDLLTEIIIPPMDKNVVSRYIKVKERGTWDFMLVSIAGSFKVDEKVNQDGKMAFGGVAPIPWLENNLNKQLKGMVVNKANISKLSNSAFLEANAMEMNSYKLIMARNLINKLFYESFNL